jgi:hypothetical protein
MRQAARRKYHYIYKTTCIVTGKYYIGMHSTDDLNDGYVGSGKRLWYSINKHGKDNHVCEILEFLPDRKSLKAREAELVCEEQLTDPLCMNLKVGGEGGFDHINENPELKRKTASDAGKVGGPARMQKFKSDTKRYQEHLDASAKRLTDLHADGTIAHTLFVKGGTRQIEASRKAHTSEAKLKRTKTFEKNKHQQGEKNSQFGSCWIFSIVEKAAKKIAKTDLESYLQNGWQVGRKMKFD